MSTLQEQTAALAQRVAKEFVDVRKEIAEGSGGSFSGSASDVTYGNYGYDNVGAALDSLLYVAINITGFSNNAGNKENGQVVSSVTFNWSLNKTPTTLKFNGEAIDVNLRSKTLTGLTIKSGTSWSLVATDEKGASSTRSTGISFYDKRYWGVSSVSTADDITNAMVLGLSSELAGSRGKTFTLNAGTGEYIYYAFPASWGTPKFTVGGFEGGFSLVKTFNFTNASGYTASYVVYRSDNPSLGSTTVAVS